MSAKMNQNSCHTMAAFNLPQDFESHDPESEGIITSEEHDNGSLLESTASESIEEFVEPISAHPRSRVPKRKQVIKKTKDFDNRKREKYQTVSNKTRLELIQRVERGGASLKDAATELTINYSTAKSIFSMYKKEGRILKKVNRRRFEAVHSEISQNDSRKTCASSESEYSQETASVLSRSEYDEERQLESDATRRHFCCPNCTAPLSLQRDYESGRPLLVIVREAPSRYMNEITAENFEKRIVSSQKIFRNVHEALNAVKMYHQYENQAMGRENVEFQYTNPQIATMGEEFMNVPSDDGVYMIDERYMQDGLRKGGEQFEYWNHQG